MKRFTENQRRAIDTPGNVLVIAGAGTGKTRTLVQRCIEWLLQAPGRNSLEEVLMVTFTDAAAAEMRQRVREALKEQLEREPHRSHLTEQLALLDTAFISTLHSFCFQLVRQHFYELGLDPQPVVLPAEEAQLLAEETLTALLAEHYAGQDQRAQAVQRLIQNQARGWDLPIRRLILRLHHYRQTLPDPDQWLRDQLNLFSQAEPHLWRRWLCGTWPVWRNGWLDVLRAFGTDNPNLNACREALQELPPNPDLAQARHALAQILAARDQDWPRGSVKTVRDRLKDFFTEADFLHGLTTSSPLKPELMADLGRGWTDDLRRASNTHDPLLQDWCWTRSQMLTLLELTAEFGDRFAEAKRERGVVDFHDLEQFSLRLLWDREKRVPTALAEQWRRRLRLVFVDEYQDINAAQDAVLTALAGTGPAANRFLVGDPKQSIYRFRLADPHIFQAYTSHWQGDPSQGRVIALTDNFRSHEAILRFVNAFFSQVMRTEIGGVLYDEAAWLKFGDPETRRPFTCAAVSSASSNSRPNRALLPVELHLRLKDRDSAPGASDAEPESNGLWDNLTDTEKEARLVGLRLAELRAQEAPIWDAQLQRHRPVQWRDMVILLRSPARKVEGYAKEFSRLGIPLLATRGGFFDALEVSDLLSLLMLLDNPIQDLPLLAVLRSPIVALSFDELAAIRLTGPGRFWNVLQQFHNLFTPSPDPAPGEELQVRPNQPLSPELQALLTSPQLKQVVRGAWGKIDLFLGRFTQWRRLVREASLSQCLDRILNETQFCLLLMAQPRGPERRRNVSKLLTWARQFDEFEGQGLYRFLRFIEAQKEARIEHEPAPLDTEQAVRLMSIHQSKGLEFGIVVVADLGKPFNLIDLKADVILDEEFGLCPLVKPPGTQQRYPSLPYWLAQRRQRREMLGEEMRLLYVAMTRAAQSLILVGSATRSATERWLQKDLQSPRDLASSRGYLDWLGPWLSTTMQRPDWLDQPAGQTDLFRWVIHGPEDPPAPESEDLTPVTSAPAQAVSPEDEEAGRALLRKLTERYAFQLAVQQPAKLSVSTVREGIVAEVDDEAEESRRPVRKPQPGLPEKPLPAAALGVAHHRFLQFLDLDQVEDVARLEAEAQRLERAEILSAVERSALDLPAIAAFWHSEVGQAILRHRSSIRRELPFTARLSLEELQSWAAAERAALTQSREKVSNPKVDWLAQEFVVLTGVVDLAVLLPQEIWLLDFKTDAVRLAEWEAKAQTYAPQLRLYQIALSRIYGRPVTRAWLHSLPLRLSLAVPLPRSTPT